MEKWQFGDFQTPDSLAREVVRTLRVNHQILPEVIMEPSCGKGAFLRAALNIFENSKIIGWDINKEYVKEAKLSVSEYSNSGSLTVYESDFFGTDWKNFSKNSGAEIRDERRNV